MSPSASLPEPWSGVREQLHERGMRWTPQRRTVIEVLAASSGHVSSAELIERCRARDPQTIPSTVYRTLDALEQLGLVRHGHGADGREEFHVGPDAEHGHLYCADCGARSEIRAAEADALVTALPGCRRLRGRPVARDGGGALRLVRRASRRGMSHTLLGLPSIDPAALAAGDADAVVLGVPFGVPYPTPGPAAGCAEAPAAIRARSQHLARFATHHDFDLDGPMLPPGSTYRVADAGDVPGSAEDGAGNAAATEAVVRQLLGVGAVPLLLGGDDSVPDPPAPRLRRPRADHRGPGRCPPGLPRRAVGRARRLLVRHATGLRDGARQRIVQVGLRGVGSARPSDVADARAAGNLLVTARELDERGVPWLLEQLPADASVVVCFDLDGLDPSVAPAVSGTAPGGLTYAQAAAPAAGADCTHPGGRRRLHGDGSGARRQ